jgi:plastocyanin
LWAAALGVAGLVAAGPVAQAATKSVLVGGPTPKGAPEQTDVNAFLPHTITIHQGDSVLWRVRGFHTVTLVPKGQRAPGLVSVDPTHPVAGVNDANNVPFWFNGQPSLIINPRVGFRAGGKKVTGSSYLNSGVPGPGPLNYRLTFPRRGTFTFACMVHPGMRGIVRVVRRSQRIPTTARDAAVVRRERAAVAAAATRAAKLPTQPGVVSLGRTGGTSTRFSIQDYFPDTTTIKVGDSVTFTMAGQDQQEVHTVTTGPQATIDNLEKNIVVPRANASGPPTLVLSPLAFYPSDPVLPPYDGANHGDGFLNSGVLDNVAASPTPGAVRVTFTKAGTYMFHCVIHPGMHGMIVVTQ